MCQSHDKVVVKSRANPSVSFAANTPAVHDARLQTRTLRAQEPPAAASASTGDVLFVKYYVFSCPTHIPNVPESVDLCRCVRWRIRQPTRPTYLNVARVFARHCVWTHVKPIPRLKQPLPKPPPRNALQNCCSEQCTRVQPKQHDYFVRGCPRPASCTRWNVRIV